MKVTISQPDALVKEIERYRSAMFMKRSTFYSLAAASFLAQQRTADALTKYVQLLERDKGNMTPETVEAFGDLKRLINYATISQRPVVVKEQTAKPST